LPLPPSSQLFPLVSVRVSPPAPPKSVSLLGAAIEPVIVRAAVEAVVAAFSKKPVGADIADRRVIIGR
jgi:hypothetical protein